MSCRLEAAAYEVLLRDVGRYLYDAALSVAGQFSRVVHRGVAQDSLVAETRGTNVAVHLASPGMVATDLLLAGPHRESAKRIINVLAEDSATVAAWLVPRMRGVTGSGKYFRCDQCAEHVQYVIAILAEDMRGCAIKQGWSILVHVAVRRATMILVAEHCPCIMLAFGLETNFGALAHFLAVGTLSHAGAHAQILKSGM